MEDREGVALPGELLELVESNEARLTRESFGRWSPEVREWASASRFLAEAEIASDVVCDACDADHVEVVELASSEDEGAPRYFIRCPEAGAVEVSPDRLRGFAIDLDRFAAILQMALGAAGTVREIVPARLWNIGTARAGETVRSFFLARGLTWADGHTILAHAALRSLRDIVLLAVRFPTDPGKATDIDVTSQNLRGLLSVGPQGLAIEAEALAALRGPQHPRKRKATKKSFPTPSGTTWPDVWIALDEFSLQVDVRGRTGTYSYDEIGFGDRRTGKAPSQLWHLLQDLASRLGTLEEKDMDLSIPPAHLKRYVSSLRGCIKELFLEVEGDPIPSFGTKSHSMYRSEFHIGPATPSGLPNLPRRRSISDIAITEGLDERHFDVSVRDVTLRVAYCYAGLGSLDGKLNAAGDRMTRLLATAEPLMALDTDNGMLELGSSLATLFGLDDPPFTFEPSSGGSDEPGAWRPLFAITKRRR